MTPLIKFSVSLRESGDIQTEIENLNPREFQRIMDEWNPKYKNTLTISYMVRNVLRDLNDLNYMIGRYLK